MRFHFFLPAIQSLKYQYFDTVKAYCPAVEGLEPKYESVIRKCQPGQPFYFSTLSELCVEDCKSKLLKLNKDFVKRCPLTPRSRADMLPFYLWSNTAILELLCLREAGKERFCLADLVKMELALSQGLFDPADCRGRCVEEFVASNFQELPSLYYSRINDHKKLKKDLKVRCLT